MITAKTLVEENALTSAQWVSGFGDIPPNPILPDRVLGYDTTLRKYKMGDGVSAWSGLQWWSDETSLPFIEFVIAVGDPLPYQRSLPSAYQNGVIIQQWRCLTGGLREASADALPQALMVGSSTNLGNLIQRLDFYGYDDGTGHQLDPPLYYTITKA